MSTNYDIKTLLNIIEDMDHTLVAISMLTDNVEILDLIRRTRRSCQLPTQPRVTPSDLFQAMVEITKRHRDSMKRFEE